MLAVHDVDKATALRPSSARPLPALASLLNQRKETTMDTHKQVTGVPHAIVTMNEETLVLDTWIYDDRTGNWRT